LFGSTTKLRAKFCFPVSTEKLERVFMAFSNKLIAISFLQFLIGTTNAAERDGSALVLRGQRLFLQCKSCHEITDTKIVKIGPNLKGVLGRPVASYPGFNYSKALQSLTFQWNDEELDRWLEKPTQIAPATTMAFIGLPTAADRKAVIAYLQSIP
jgi:cytochrome c